MRTFAIGESASYTKTITDKDVSAFAQLSGDHNPIHLNAEYAQQTRFKQRIAHGILVSSLISTVIGMQLPGAGAIYLGQELKFTKPVFLDDTITATATIIEYQGEKRILSLQTECTNQNGEIVLTGTAKVLYEPIN